MKKILLLAPLLLLTACGAQNTAGKVTLQDHLQNPLFGERYWAEMVDRMVNLQLDPGLSKDESRRKLVDSLRLDSLNKEQEQTKKRREGLLGHFVTVKEQTDGMTLLLGDRLFLSPEFTAYPGPALHIYLSNVVDPRDAAFPDATAVDLGPLETPYGSQEYAVPAKPDSKPASVVLYDTDLGLIYGFAQLSK